MNSIIKILIGTLIGVAISHVTFAQKNNEYTVNQLNKDDKKEGLWIEGEYNYGHYNVKTETYYKNGKKHGVTKGSTADGRLSFLGEYTNNTMSGTWYSFDGNHLSWIMSQFDTNFHVVVHDYIGEYVPDFKCWYRSFHPNGTIEWEGIIIWNEEDDPEIFSYTIGQGRWYNDQRQLICVELHLDGDIH